MEETNGGKEKTGVPVPQGDVFDALDAVNKYGTYNVQDTADTENLFPQISGGLPRQNPKTKGGARKENKGKYTPR